MTLMTIIRAITNVRDIWKDGSVCYSSAPGVSGLAIRILASLHLRSRRGYGVAWSGGQLPLPTGTECEAAAMDSRFEAILRDFYWSGEYNSQHHVVQVIREAENRTR